MCPLGLHWSIASLGAEREMQKAEDETSPRKEISISVMHGSVFRFWIPPIRWHFPNVA